VSADGIADEERDLHPIGRSEVVSISRTWGRIRHSALGPLLHGGPDVASRFTELAIDCADPHALARFWCAVLDYQPCT